MSNEQAWQNPEINEEMENPKSRNAKKELIIDLEVHFPSQECVCCKIEGPT